MRAAFNQESISRASVQPRSPIRIIMKTSLVPHSRRAFTLIELLVVISIISMLAGLVAAAANRVLRNGNAVKTKTALKDLVLGIKNYQVEYGRYPLPAGHSGEEAIPLSAGSSVLKILLGRNESKMNPKEVAYIEPPMGRHGAGGLTGSEGSYELDDMWGTPFEVIVDANYDNKIANPDILNEDAGISSCAPRDILAGSVALSYGADKKKGSKDDVASWR